MAKIGIEDAIGERSPGRLLRRIHRLADKRMKARFEADESIEDWMALKLINDGLVEQPGDLAREFNIGTGAATRLINGLEEKGFIERARTGEDRRVVLLEMTQLGKDFFLEKSPDIVECWTGILEGFSQTEVNQLNGLLTKLLASLEANAK